jgi:acetyl-CoA acetyltransferase
MVALAAGEALGGAGMNIRDVDAVFVNSMGEEGSVQVGDYIGIEARYGDSTDLGGGSFEAFVQYAILAIAAGHCEVALIAYASRQRSRENRKPTAEPETYSISGQFESPFRPFMPLTPYALIAARHMNEFGTTSEQLAEVALTAREWARMNPKAWSRDPLTVDDALSSQLYVTPFHRHDICLRFDGGGVVVVTGKARARDAAKTPIRVMGAAHGHTHWHVSQLAISPVPAASAAAPTRSRWRGSVTMTSTRWNSTTISPVRYPAARGPRLLQPRRGWSVRAGGAPAAGRPAAMPHHERRPLLQSPGRAIYLAAGGGRTPAAGRMRRAPGARQLRGECGERQVPGAEVGVVHGIGGISNSAAATVVLSRE